MLLAPAVLASLIGLPLSAVRVSPVRAEFALSGNVLEHRDDRSREPVLWLSTTVGAKDVRLAAVGDLMKLVPGIANEKEAFELSQFVATYSGGFSGYSCSPVMPSQTHSEPNDANWPPAHPADKLWVRAPLASIGVPQAPPREGWLIRRAPEENSYRWEPEHHRFVLRRRVSCSSADACELFRAEETASEHGEYALTLKDCLRQRQPAPPRPALGR